MGPEQDIGHFGFCNQIRTLPFQRGLLVRAEIGIGPAEEVALLNSASCKFGDQLVAFAVAFIDDKRKDHSYPDNTHDADRVAQAGWQTAPVCR